MVSENDNQNPMPDSAEIVKMNLDGLRSVIQEYTAALLEPTITMAQAVKFRERRNLAEGLYRRRMAGSVA